jgi:hypothetical protein
MLFINREILPWLLAHRLSQPHDPVANGHTPGAYTRISIPEATIEGLARRSRLCHPQI